MAVGRRLVGAGLAGLGQALAGWGEMRLKRRELAEKAQAEQADAQGKALSALRTTIGQNPEIADLVLQLAAADPLLRGVDLGAFRPDPQILAQIEHQKDTARQKDIRFKGEEAHATAAGTGRGQYEVAQERADFDVDQARRIAEGTQLGTHSPAVGQARVSNEQLMTPVLVDRAGQTAGAQARAVLAPDIVRGKVDEARQIADAQAPDLPPGLSDDQRTAALQLMNAFRSDSQTFKVREESFRTVLSAAKEPSAAGDLSLIFGYMRLLDPGSTVREGEFANAQNAAGVPTQVRNIYNRLMSGERLAPDQRADFVRQAFNNYQAAKAGQQRIIKDYLDKAVQYGVPPGLVIRELDPDLDKEPPGPVIPGSTLNSLLGDPIPTRR